MRLAIAVAFGVLISCGLLSGPCLAADADLQAKIAQKKELIASWGKDPELVAAVKEIIATPPEAAKGMTQADWESLTILDPKVRTFQSNKVGTWLKTKKEMWVAEAFVSIPDGTKAGFLSKPSSWSHKGKDKHDKPMLGQAWQGEMEQDKSTAKMSVQVAVPVLDGATPIGSLTVGIDVNNL